MKLIKIGDTFYNQQNKKCTIVAVLDNEPQPQYVYRVWSKFKYAYQYHIESIGLYNLSLKGDLYSINKKELERNERNIN